jgi:hypothetical protein
MMSNNLALACPTCNYYKSNQYTRSRRRRLGWAGRYSTHRKDRWDEHFEFDRVSLELKGKPAQGSGTGKQLRMNHRMQIEVRTLWAELDLYP